MSGSVDRPKTGQPDNSSASPSFADMTIGRALRLCAQRFPDHDAYVFTQLRQRMTWSQLDQETDTLARALLGLGFRPGDHFGVWSTNVPRWVQLQFATARIGVVLVTINPSYRAHELEYVVRQADLKGLALVDEFKTTDYFSLLNQVCPELSAHDSEQELQSASLPRLKRVIALRGETPPGALSWEALLAAGRSVSADALSQVEHQLKPSDPINIQYTSGTTGHPKGAMLTHKNILLNAHYAAENQRLGDRDRICLPVPLYHCFGCVLGTLCCVVRGAAMVFPGEGFDAGRTLAAIQEEGCTSIYGVPTMFIAELEHPEYPQTRVSTLRTGIMAGSPCPIELMKRVTQDMGASEITIGYGQTEASPLITQTRTDDPIELRVGTVGQAIAGIEVKIVDPETGEALSDGQQGELCSRGHGVMLGYYNMPEKTSESIDPEGWLHTGDLALREANGYFRITGRLRDMIIRGGENIYPREIEECLYRHPAVEDVQVVGIPSAKYGEEVLAWVKLRANHQVVEAELAEFCRDELSHFKVPHYWKFVDSFPTTVTGKIQKYKIREQAIEDYGLQDLADIETA